MKKQRTAREAVQWIVVTDQVQARIWSRHPHGADRQEPPTLLESIEHPEGHLREQDLVSDEPGRMTARGRGHTQAMKQRGSAKTTEAHRFAAAIGAHLAAAWEQSLFDEVAVVAAPRWLGILREHLTPEVARRLVATIPHSLMHDRIDDIVARVVAASGGATAVPFEGRPPV